MWNPFKKKKKLPPIQEAFDSLRGVSSEVPFESTEDIQADFDRLRGVNQQQPIHAEPVDKKEHKQSLGESAMQSYRNYSQSGMGAMASSARALESTGKRLQGEDYFGDTQKYHENKSGFRKAIDTVTPLHSKNRDYNLAVSKKLEETKFGQKYIEPARKAVGEKVESVSKYAREGLEFGAEAVMDKNVTGQGYIDTSLNTFRNENGEFDKSKLLNPRVIANMTSQGAGSIAVITSASMLNPTLGVGSAFLMEKGDAVESYSVQLAKDRGVKVEDLSDEDIANLDVSATNYGIISSGLEYIFPAKLLKKLGGKEAVNAINKRIWTRVPKGVAEGMLLEGGTEGVQRFTQNVVGNLEISENIELTDGVLDEAIAGALAGGGMSGVASIKGQQQPSDSSIKTMEDVVNKINEQETKLIQTKKEPEDKKEQDKAIDEQILSMPTEDSKEFVNRLEKLKETQTLEEQEKTQKYIDRIGTISENKRIEVSDTVLKLVEGEKTVDDIIELPPATRKEAIEKVQKLSETESAYKEPAKKIVEEVKQKITIQNEIKEKKKELLEEKYVNKEDSEKKKELQSKIDELDDMRDDSFDGLGELFDDSNSIENIDKKRKPEYTKGEKITTKKKDYEDTTSKGATVSKRKSVSNVDEVGKNGRKLSTGKTGADSKAQQRESGNGSSKLGERPKDGQQLTPNYKKGDVIIQKDNERITKDTNKSQLKKIKALAEYEGKGGTGKADAGILDQYFTPKVVVDEMWDIAEIMTNEIKGIKKVLEPSVGTGRFLSGKDKGFDITAFEKDPELAKMTREVYGNRANIITGQLESLFVDKKGKKLKFDADYDVVIGNPPYGKHRGLYKGLGEEPKIGTYEEYFIKRGLDLLKDDGVLAMIVPSGFLRKRPNTTKKKIADIATLKSAYRLPNGIFENTEVGTDILVFKKGEKMSADLLSNNKYFEENSQNVLGKEGERKGQFGLEPFVEGDLNTAIQKMQEDTKLYKESAEQEQKMQEPAIEREQDVTPTQMKVIREESIAEEVVAKSKPTKAERKAVKKTKKKKGKKKQNTVLFDGLAEVDADKKYFIKSVKKDDTTTFTQGYQKESDILIAENTLEDGSVDTDVVAKSDLNYSKGKYFGDFNYYQGDIYQKLEQLEQDKDNMSEEQYNKQKAGLEKVKPTPLDIKDIILLPNDKFVHEFRVESKTLADSFIEWTQDLPRDAMFGISAYDIAGYVNGQVVNTGNKERNAELRKKRRDVGNDLFQKYYKTELGEKAKKNIVDTFNKNLNNYHKPDYTQYPISPVLNKTFYGNDLKLRDIQMEGAAFLTNKGVGLLAYDVGVGKTLAGIAAIAEVMRKGWAKKPLIVVPKNLKTKWIEDMTQAIPGIKINDLANLGGQFKGVKEDLVIDEGTISIVTEDGFKRLSYSDETFDKLTRDLQDTTHSMKKKSKRGVEQDKAKAEEVIGMARKGTDFPITFEDLGFDHITIDEAHREKNVFAKAEVKKEAGERKANEYGALKGATSERGLKAYLAAQYILSQNNGRNVFLLTATPFTNSPIEIYSVLSLMAKNRLEELGIKNVNDFISSFIDIESKFAIKASGALEQVDQVRNFNNLQQLQKLVLEYIDFRTGEEAGVPRPTKHQKKPTLRLSELQAEYIGKAQELFTSKEGGGVLAAITELQKITLSPYLSRYHEGGVYSVKPEEFVKNSPKIAYVVESIKRVHKKDPSVGQIIFAEKGIESFHVLKNHFVEDLGYDPDTVQILDSSVKEAKKDEMQSKFQSGEIKILMASGTVKEGIDLQKNSTDLYNIYLPWNPTDMLQIEGRSWRQGSDHKNVRIHYPLVENTIDSFMFQKLEEKAARLQSIWSSNERTVDVSDIDFEKMKFELITDPRKRLEAEKQFNTAELEFKQEALESEISFLERKTGGVSELKEDLKRAEEAVARGNDWMKSSVSSKKRQLKNLLESLKGVDVADMKKQLKEKEVELKDVSKDIADFDAVYEEKAEAIKGESLKLTTGETDFDEVLGDIGDDGFYEKNVRMYSNEVTTEEIKNTAENKKIQKTIKKILPQLNPAIQDVVVFEVMKKINDKGTVGGDYFNGFIRLSETMQEKEMKKIIIHEVMHLTNDIIFGRDKQELLNWYKNLKKEDKVAIFKNENTYKEYVKLYKDENTGKINQTLMAEEAFVWANDEAFAKKLDPDTWLAKKIKEFQKIVKQILKNMGKVSTELKEIPEYKSTTDFNKMVREFEKIFDTKNRLEPAAKRRYANLIETKRQVENKRDNVKTDKVSVFHSIVSNEVYRRDLKKQYRKLSTELARYEKNGDDIKAQETLDTMSRITHEMVNLNKQKDELHRTQSITDDVFNDNNPEQPTNELTKNIKTANMAVAERIVKLRKELNKAKKIKKDIIEEFEHSTKGQAFIIGEDVKVVDTDEGGYTKKLKKKLERENQEFADAIGDISEIESELREIQPISDEYKVGKQVMGILKSMSQEKAIKKVRDKAKKAKKKALDELRELKDEKFDKERAKKNEKIKEIREDRDEKIKKEKIKSKEKLDKEKLKAKKIQQAKEIVVAYANENLKAFPEQKKRLLATVKNAKNMKDVINAINFIDRLFTQAQTRHFKEQIKKQLKVTKLKKKNGKPLAKYEAEAQRVLDIMKKITSMTKKQALNHIANNLATENGVLNDYQILENAIIEAYFIDQTAESLARFLESIIETKKTGKLSADIKKFNRAEETERVRETVIDVITGGVGVKSSAFFKKNKWKKARDRAKVAFESMIGWDNIMDVLSFHNSSNPNESFLSTHFDMLPHTNNFKGGVRVETEKSSELYKKTFGLTSDRQLRKKQKNDMQEINLGKFEIKGENGTTTEEIIMSKAQIRKRILELKDETLMPTFEKMGYNKEIIEAMTAQLTQQDLAFIKAQQEFYRDYYHKISESYKEAYGVYLPYNHNYSPIRRKGFDFDGIGNVSAFLEEQTERANILKGSMKDRKPNTLPIMEMDDFSVMNQHIVEMEHFIAFQEISRELNAVFLNPEVKEAIKQNFDYSIYKTLNYQIDNIIRGGADRANQIAVLDKIRHGIVRYTLAIKPSILFKQVTSFVAFVDSIPTKDFIAGTTLFMANPISNYKMLKEKSELLKNRGKGIDIHMKEAMSSPVWNMLMLNVRIGDMMGIVLGGYSVYRHALKGGDVRGAVRKEGMTNEEYAVYAFEKVTSQTQQSPDITEQSRWQTMGSLPKFFTTYQSAPNQYFRKELGAIRNLIAGRGSAKNNIKTIAVYHFLIPTVFQYVASGFDWDEDDMKRAWILGSANGIFLLNDMIEGSIRVATGNRAYSNEIILYELGNSFYDMLRYIVSSDKTEEEWDKFIEGGLGVTGMGTGIPTNTAYNMIGGVVDADALRAFGFSKWTVDRRSPEGKMETYKKKVKKARKAGDIEKEKKYQNKYYEEANKLN